MRRLRYGNAACTVLTTPMKSTSKASAKADRRVRTKRTDPGVGDDHVELAEFVYGIGEFAAPSPPGHGRRPRRCSLAAGLLDFKTGFFEIMRVANGYSLVSMS